MLRSVLLCLTTVCLISQASADDIADAALVIAVDVSGSMSAEELTIQRQGYVRALSGDAFGMAAASGPLGKVALTYIEWADPGMQVLTVPWRIIDGPAAAQAFAAELEARPVASGTNTSISSALVFSAALFGDLPIQAERWIIDISGDGVNTAGPHVAPTRDRVVARGIVINGLPVELADRTSDQVSGVELAAYYRDCVIGGPGAFVLPVAGIDGIAAAVERKMVREIAAAVPATPALVAAAAEPRADCTAGQKDFYE